MIDANNRLIEAEDKARAARNEALSVGDEELCTLADAVVQGLQAIREILDSRR